MIELPPAQLRVANAIHDGASTVDEICAAIGTGHERVKRILGQVGDTLGIPRLGRIKRDCDRPRVIAAVRAANGFVLRAPAPYESRNILGRDSMPLLAPAEWPAYYGGTHDLGTFR